MESEKVKEIKKALECCKQNEIENTCEYCSDCPANNWDYETECNVELLQKALTLINELESENERLNECYRVKAYDKLRAENKKLKNRIAELENNYQNVCVLLTAKNEQLCDLTKENERLKNCIATLKNKVYAKEGYYNAVKDRALEVFANKLKEKADGICVKNDILYTIKSSEIDETLKECLGK